MPTLTIVPAVPSAERRYQPFVDFLQSKGWASEFVRLDRLGLRPAFGDRRIFPQVRSQTGGKIVMGFSLGALYAHIGALQAKHLILASISPFFKEDYDEPERWEISYREGNSAIPVDVMVGEKEDAQMHRRAESVREFYDRSTYTVVAGADHELWHPNYLTAVGEALARLKG